MPSSLFGGRWQASINTLGRRQERREQLKKAVTKTGTGSGQLMLTGQKRAQPFRDQGAHAPSKKKKANQQQSGSANQPSSSARPQKKQGGRKKNRGSARGQGSDPKSGGKGSQPKKD